MLPFSPSVANEKPAPVLTAGGLRGMRRCQAPTVLAVASGCSEPRGSLGLPKSIDLFSVSASPSAAIPPQPDPYLAAARHLDGVAAGEGVAAGCTTCPRRPATCARGWMGKGSDERLPVRPRQCGAGGPQSPVSHLVCGGAYDWSTGRIYKGERYLWSLLGEKGSIPRAERDTRALTLVISALRPLVLASFHFGGTGSRTAAHTGPLAPATRRACPVRRSAPGP